MEDNAVNKPKPLQWLLFLVIIPLLFAITVALIVSTIAGVNVFQAAKEYGNKVPVIGDMLNKDDQKVIEEFEQERIGLEGQIKDREAKIEQLQSKIDNKDKAVDRLQLEKEQLLQQIDDLNAIQKENKRAFKDIVRTYETLSSKKAAPIIAKMSDEEALKLLTNVNAETLAKILENMKAEEAAKYTELLTNESDKAREGS